MLPSNVVICLLVMVILATAMVRGADSGAAESIAAPDLLWSRSFGGMYGDIPHGIAVTADGGYILLASVQQSPGANYDIMLIRTDANGNVLWNRTYGTDKNEEGYAIAPVADGGCAIAGYADYRGNGSRDMYVARVDDDGNLVWDRTFGFEGHDAAFGIAAATDGGYAVSGYTSEAEKSVGAVVRLDSDGNVLWYHSYVVSHQEYDKPEKLIGMFDALQQTTDGGFVAAGYVYFKVTQDFSLARLDPEGNLLWFNNYGGPGSERAYGVGQTADGGYVLSGNANSILYLLRTDANGSKLWDRPFAASATQPGSVHQMPDGGYVAGGGYIVRTDSQGMLRWEKTINHSGYSGMSRVVPNADGSFTIFGGVFANPLPGGGNNVDLYLARTVPESNVPPAPPPNNSAIRGDPPVIAWNYTYGGSVNEYGAALSRTYDGGYIATGYRKSADDEDVYLVKTDGTGRIEWDGTYGGAGLDRGNDVRQTRDGGYIVVGWTQSSGKGLQDVYLLKTGPTGNTEWNRTFGGSMTDEGFSVIQAADGGYVIAGQSASFGDRNFYGYLVKTDASGNLQWETCQIAQQTIRGAMYGVIQAADGGYLACGTGYFDGNADAWLIKVNAEGRPIWDRRYGGPDSEGASSIGPTADGGYIICGSRADAFLCLVRVDALGNELWNRSYSEARKGPVYQMPDGGFIAGSNALVRTDAAGEVRWDWRIDGIGVHGSPHAMVSNGDGSYTVTGERIVGGGPIWPNTDLVLLKTGPEVLATPAPAPSPPAPAASDNPGPEATPGSGQDKGPQDDEAMYYIPIAAGLLIAIGCSAAVIIVAILIAWSRRK